MEEIKREDVHGSLATCSKSTSIDYIFMKKGSKNKHEGVHELLAKHSLSNLGCLKRQTRRCMTWSTMATEVA